MELSFAAAGWAWGLFSLALPILIHFFASRQQQPRRFAAMRFLPEGAEQGSARRISDWLLLLLRLLLLAALVAALMAPTLRFPQAREQHWLLRHPDVPAGAEPVPALASPSEAFAAYWLCPDAALQPLTAICEREDAHVTAQKGDRFLLDLIQLAAREPTLSNVVVQVPPQLATAPLTLPTLPFGVQWQVVNVGDAAPESSTWPVTGPAEYASLFAAANHAAAGRRWQWQSGENVTQGATDGAARDVALVIGKDDRRARVRWHNQTLPWQEHQFADATVQFHLEGESLHLRVIDASALRSDPAYFAQLLQLTDAWLGRGQLRFREDSAAVLAAMAPSNAEAIGITTQPLQSLLILFSILLLLIERGLAYAQR